MGTVHAEIKLVNINDLAYADIGHIKSDQVRTATVTAVADTGAMYPVITEELYQKLGLGKEKDATVHIADGKTINTFLTKPVRIEWKDRLTVLHTVVIPGAKKVLLGVLALEAMDLMVDPTTQQLVGAHGDKEEFLAL